MAKWGGTAALVVTLLMTSYVFGMTVVDMTHDHAEDTIYWPGNPAFNFTVLARGNATWGWYESNMFTTAEHGGTHVDAPAHFFKGGWRAQEIPPSSLVGPGVVIDVRDKVQADPDYRLTVMDITDWEAVHGRVPDNAIVMMHSGWAERYPNSSRVFNTNTPSDPKTFHFPGFHDGTATFLAKERGIIAAGVDTPSMDPGVSVLFPTHVELGRHNVIGLENLANLHLLPASGSTVVVGLIKLRDGSGGPARILGLLDMGGGTSGAAGTGSGASLALGMRAAIIATWITAFLQLVCK